MELPAFDDDELVEEALAILDSVDIERLGAFAPSAFSLQETPRESAVAHHLLEAAVQAVQKAFPQSDQSSKATEMDKSDLHHGNQESYAHDAAHVLPVSSTPENSTPRSRRRGGGRMRMREQLIQLRTVVQKMENHLEALRSPYSPRLSIDSESFEDVEAGTKCLGDENESSDTNGPERSGETTDEATVWRNIAIQQFRARRKAEQKNVELRDNLAAQMKLSKQMGKLLQAQQATMSNLLEVDPSSSVGDTKAKSDSDN